MIFEEYKRGGERGFGRLYGTWEERAERMKAAIFIWRGALYQKSTLTVPVK
ncbi:hypothetical protein FACS1894200_01060 [Spirochaetia bacterium]|nr:hypothetical protein FACS1894200_01060 [Spirochaetia bacterium]